MKIDDLHVGDPIRLAKQELASLGHVNQNRRQLVTILWVSPQTTDSGFRAYFRNGRLVWACERTAAPGPGRQGELMRVLNAGSAEESQDLHGYVQTAG